MVPATLSDKTSIIPWVSSFTHTLGKMDALDCIVWLPVGVFLGVLLVGSVVSCAVLVQVLCITCREMWRAAMGRCWCGTTIGSDGLLAGRRLVPAHKLSIRSKRRVWHLVADTLSLEQSLPSGIVGLVWDYFWPQQLLFLKTGGPEDVPRPHPQYVSVLHLLWTWRQSLWPPSIISGHDHDHPMDLQAAERTVAALRGSCMALSGRAELGHWLYLAGSLLPSASRSRQQRRLENLCSLLAQSTGCQVPMAAIRAQPAEWQGGALACWLVTVLRRQAQRTAVHGSSVYVPCVDHRGLWSSTYRLCRTNKPFLTCSDVLGSYPCSQLGRGHLSQSGSAAAHALAVVGLSSDGTPVVGCC